MGLMILLGFFLPAVFLFLYLIWASVLKGEYLQSIAYGFPFLISICTVCAYQEHQSMVQEELLKKQHRLRFIQGLSSQVATRVVTHQPSSKIREFLNLQGLSRSEKIYVMYLGWQKALEDMMKVSPSKLGMNQPQNIFTCRQQQEAEFEEMLATYGEEIGEVKELLKRVSPVSTPSQSIQS
jgi:hypothetical protein